MRTLSVTALTVVLLLAGAAPAVADLPPGGTFVDDNGDVHEGYIEAIAAAGITKGCNPPINDEYCPSDPVTRGQMAAFLTRTLGLTDDGGKDWFTDDDGSVFEADINRIAAAGITTGCNPPQNDQFCPDDRVTRGQMAAFLVRGFGYTAGATTDWFTDDDGNLFEADINRLATAGITTGCNPPANDHYCPYNYVRRDEMASFLGRAANLTPITPPPVIDPKVETVVTGLSTPVLAISPPGDDRLFVVEKTGYIRIVANDTLRSTPFLDIHTLVSGGGEQGLLGMAFHPDYAATGLFYVSYTDTAGDSRIVEYQVSGDPDVADAGSARLVLRVDQPYTNHNGGMILFDGNGYLMLGLGDGGSAGDPQNRAEDPNVLLGSLLRIDVNGGDDFPGDSNRNYAIPPDNPFPTGSGGAPEVWAYGLRNPWRFSIDDATDQIYIGDVGQAKWEEVDVAPITSGGINYGWNTLEGTHCYDPATGCSSAGTRLPVIEYSHSDGCSVTGGFVYRGSDFGNLDGHYFYSDYCAGHLRSFKYELGVVTAERDWTSVLGTVGNVTGFGVDDSGRLYILNAGGNVLRLVPDV
jgi:glucose/arabinose dehydrogenase